MKKNIGKALVLYPAPLIDEAKVSIEYFVTEEKAGDCARMDKLDKSGR